MHTAAKCLWRFYKDDQNTFSKYEEKGAVQVKTNNLDIRNVDCMKLMAEFADNHFDLAIVDPPYGIDCANMTMGSSKQAGKKYTSHAVKLKKARFSKGSGKLKNRALNKMKLNWDEEPPTQEYFEELFRVSRDQIIWGGNYFDLPPTRGIIFWDKLQPWENFSQFELGWTSFNKPAAKVAISTTGGSNKELKIHPTQKPVKLYDWLFSKYAKEGMKVLDTHMGSGSIAIAAHYAGVHLTAAEKDTEYYKDACRRIDKQTRQTTLF